MLAKHYHQQDDSLDGFTWWHIDPGPYSQGHLWLDYPQPTCCLPIIGDNTWLFPQTCHALPPTNGPHPNQFWALPQGVPLSLMPFPDPPVMLLVYVCDEENIIFLRYQEPHALPGHCVPQDYLSCILPWLEALMPPRHLLLGRSLHTIQAHHLWQYHGIALPHCSIGSQLTCQPCWHKAMVHSLYFHHCCKPCANFSNSFIQNRQCFWSSSFLMYLSNIFYYVQSHTMALALTPMASSTNIQILPTQPKQKKQLGHSWSTHNHDTSVCILYFLFSSFSWPPPFAIPGPKSPDTHPLMCLQVTSLTNGGSTEPPLT